MCVFVLVRGKESRAITLLHLTAAIPSMRARYFRLGCFELLDGLGSRGLRLTKRNRVSKGNRDTNDNRATRSNRFTKGNEDMKGNRATNEGS